MSSTCCPCGNDLEGSPKQVSFKLLSFWISQFPFFWCVCQNLHFDKTSVSRHSELLSRSRKSCLFSCIAAWSVVPLQWPPCAGPGWCGSGRGPRPGERAFVVCRARSILAVGSICCSRKACTEHFWTSCCVSVSCRGNTHK